MNVVTTTSRAFFWTYILNTPFWAIFNMLPFILYKELHASSWEIVLFATLYPVAAIFSVYWSSLIKHRRDRIKSNIVWAGLLAHTPFLLAPWIDSPLFYILAAAVYMLMVRGVIPAWMELLKLNVPGLSGRQVFATANSISYTGAALFPFLFGWLMDIHMDSWKWIFFISGSISLLAICLQMRIHIDLIPQEKYRESFKTFILGPWKSVWEVLNSRPDFLRFQLGFMFGGFGLMMMKPIMPAFFTEVLNLSYKELGIAMALCKGLGYTLTSRLWARLFGTINVYQFISLVTFIAALFPLGLISAKTFPFMFYVAWLGYGIMQGGSEMGWNMSGPLFSRHEDSSPFSSVNVLLVGLRGCVAPPLGGLLAAYGMITGSLLLVAFLCLLASVGMAYFSRSQPVAVTE